MTKVSQVASINRFASAYTEGPVISFGGIHPECENYKEILKEIKNLGLKGIKLHPDYQDMYFDNIRYERIIDAASELGLITVDARRVLIQNVRRMYTVHRRWQERFWMM